ncbi:hypothetical protein QBC33DRAFT_574684 [Phialemonium atrogriseum]|uniref:Ubiquitin-like protease family profile domain-containing protein n=1 Tax=Phialemonium atrogriseum TaxID=1093897 RepID=A0AAJ0FFV9_9PEZI|nr:uncharacterized protein QBC33DRAFT_574684 [Phialemonium atrogriseum]KAK1761773.1 hypothetical protein QBC33DRAFT_574684 [Phialemonium atrogriseum]
MNAGAEASATPSAPGGGDISQLTSTEKRILVYKEQTLKAWPDSAAEFESFFEGATARDFFRELSHLSKICPSWQRAKGLLLQARDERRGGRLPSLGPGGKDKPWVQSDTRRAIEKVAAEDLEGTMPPPPHTPAQGAPRAASSAQLSPRTRVIARVQREGRGTAATVANPGTPEAAATPATTTTPAATSASIQTTPAMSPGKLQSSTPAPAPPKPPVPSTKPHAPQTSDNTNGVAGPSNSQGQARNATTTPSRKGKIAVVIPQKRRHEATGETREHEHEDTADGDQDPPAKKHRATENPENGLVEDQDEHMEDVVEVVELDKGPEIEEMDEDHESEAEEGHKPHEDKSASVNTHNTGEQGFSAHGNSAASDASKNDAGEETASSTDGSAPNTPSPAPRNPAPVAGNEKKKDAEGATTASHGAKPKPAETDSETAGDRLEPGGWLDDNIIHKCLQTVAASQPLFYNAVDPLLVRNGRAPDWHRLHQLADPSITLLVPLHINKSHWSLATVAVKAETPGIAVDLYEPLASAASNKDAEQAARKFVDDLVGSAPYNTMWAKARRGTYGLRSTFGDGTGEDDDDGAPILAYDQDDNQVCSFTFQRCPKQTNASDCGVAILAYAFYIAAAIPMPATLDFDLWRDLVGLLYHLRRPSPTSNHPAVPSPMRELRFVRALTTNSSPRTSQTLLPTPGTASDETWLHTLGSLLRHHAHTRAHLAAQAAPLTRAAASLAQAATVFAAVDEARRRTYAVPATPGGEEVFRETQAEQLEGKLRAIQDLAQSAREQGAYGNVTAGLAQGSRDLAARVGAAKQARVDVRAVLDVLDVNIAVVEDLKVRIRARIEALDKPVVEAGYAPRHIVL